MATVVEKEVRIPRKVVHRGVPYLRQSTGVFTDNTGEPLDGKVHSRILDGKLKGLDSVEYDPAPRTPSTSSTTSFQNFAAAAAS